jgi:histidinol-phosphate phosphatase family protein
MTDPAALEFKPRAAEGLRWLQTHGFRLVVVTNQSGVGRGLIAPEQLAAMNLRLHAMVRAVGARLEGIYFCPHAPEIGCACRKPAIGLMTQAAAELGFEPSSAVVIGDRPSDIDFGRRAGATTILIAGAPSAADLASRPHFIAADLEQAAHMITSRPAERRN